jgi:hypothetical protein
MESSPPAGWYTSGSLPAEIDWSRDLVVHVPLALGRKQPLFNVLQSGLELPGYFGANWDALEECLRDFWWLPDERVVWLIHGDLPFSPTSANRGIYLDVLKECVTHWQRLGEPRLRVHFSAETPVN